MLTSKSAVSSICSRRDHVEAESALEESLPSAATATITSHTDGSPTPHFEYITPTARPAWFKNLLDQVEEMLLDEQSFLQSVQESVLQRASTTATSTTTGTSTTTTGAATITETADNSQATSNTANGVGIAELGFGEIAAAAVLGSLAGL